MKTKICSKCGATKTLDQFHKCARTKDGLQPYCKDCVAKIVNTNYKKDPSKFKASANASRLKHRKMYLDLFKGKACADCGNTNPIVFELDHREGSDKVMEVSTMINKRSWKALLNEFNKCDIVCANCHRIRTATRAGWLKAEHPTSTTSC